MDGGRGLWDLSLFLGDGVVGTGTGNGELEAVDEGLERVAAFSILFLARSILV